MLLHNLMLLNRHKKLKNRLKMILIKEYTYIILVIIVSNNSLINTKYLIDYIY